MVTVFSANRMGKQTVFTNAEGRYLIVVDYEGELTVRARASGFADATEKIFVGAADTRTIDLTVTGFDSDLDRSNALPASAHLTKLPWRSNEERGPFVAQCNYCHQVGNPLTRGKRTAESWAKSIEAKEEFKTYPLPTLSPDEYETPYALNVHPQTGDVWMTSNMSDRILRFIPKEERFISYPSPTRVTWLRDLAFTEDGQVCSSSSNLPAYAIEDGVPSFICLDPVGADRDRALAASAGTQP